MSAVEESPKDNSKVNVTFEEKVRYAFEDPTPHSTIFTRVIGIVGAIAAFLSAVFALVSSIIEFSFTPLYRTPLNFCVLVFFIIFSLLMMLIEIFPGSTYAKNVIGDTTFLGHLFGRGWFYLVLGTFYVCSGHIVCTITGVYLLVVGVIFVTLGAIRHSEEGWSAEEELEVKSEV